MSSTATLSRCPQVCDGRHFNRTLLASSKGEPLAHLVWTCAIKLKAPSLGGSETRPNFYISSNKHATLPRVKLDIAIRVTTLCKRHSKTTLTTK